jgi:S1-C subfamily serine protease
MEQARDIELQRRARQARQALMAQKSFEVAIQNALGFKPEAVSPAEYPDLQGIFVASLLSDYSPAALAHIQAGDVIKEVNGQAVPTMSEMDRILSSIRPGTEVAANLYRDGQAVAVRIRVADRTAAPILPMTDPRDEGFLGLGNVVRRCCAPGSKRWGLEVRRVIDNSPADLAGLRLGDLVTEFNGQATLTADEFSRRIRASEPRQKLKLKFYRGNTEHTVEFILGHGWLDEVTRARAGR